MYQRIIVTVCKRFSFLSKFYTYLHTLFARQAAVLRILFKKNIIMHQKIYIHLEILGGEAHNVETILKTLKYKFYTILCIVTLLQMRISVNFYITHRLI